MIFENKMLDSIQVRKSS